MANKFNLDDISELLKVLKDNEVTEFKLEREDEKISLKRGAKAPEVQYIQAPQPIIQAEPAVQAQPALQAVPAPQAPAATNTEAPQAQPVSLGEEVPSPMVGTFYSRPSPDADPYVSVGDTIKKGDKLCIIEAMKIMNEIEAEKSGKILKICLDDGQMAEYGEALFEIEPL